MKRSKSQLAIEYAHKLRRTSPETWILWLYASNQIRLEQSVSIVLEQLRVHGRKDPKANMFQLLRNRLCDTTQGPWLVILDNADVTRVLTGHPYVSEQVDKPAKSAYLDCIPPCEYGQLLVISRTASAAKELVEWKDVISVEPMDEDQALALLHNKPGVWYIEQHAV
jgi:hypothetical protein